MKRIILFFLFSAIYSGIANADVIASKDIKDEKGETEAKGSYSIADDGNTLTITQYLKVTKTGMTGTGKGTLSLQIFGDNDQVIYSKTCGESVGATLRGAESKDSTCKGDKILIGPQRTKFLDQCCGIAFTIQVGKDTNTLADLTNELNNTSIQDFIKGLSGGETKNVEKWFFQRISK